MHSIQKSQTIRVKLEDLDSLVDLVGEIMIAKMRLDQVSIHSTGASDAVAQMSRSLSRLISDLQLQTMKIRLVPIDQIFDRFPRMVRDLAASLGKEVKLEVLGRGVELDRTVLDAITDPLLHILRNAVDHGIEAPEDRQSRGKSREGSIRLVASRVSDKVLIEIIDDGRGIDLDRLRQKAVERKLVTREAAQGLSEQETIMLLGTPGLSTATRVSDVSGRGVGMDVVFRKIEAVGGQVKISTEKGRGTSISLAIPTSLAIVGGVLVSVRTEKYVVPISNIIAILSVEEQDIKVVNNVNVVSFRGQTVPLLDAAQLLQIPHSHPETETKSKNMLTAMIMEKNGRPIAVVVDSVQSKQDVVLKHLDKTGYLAAATPSDATILSDGRIALVIDSTQF